jgi:hypothetical protein
MPKSRPRRKKSPKRILALPLPERAGIHESRRVGSTNRDGRISAAEALFTTRSIRLSQAPAVLGHHHARQLLREPHHRSVACVG